MNTKNSSQPISRRNMLRTSGALAASGVVLAACGSSGATVTRIGESPTTLKLEDKAVTDLVLLRTAMSVETMVAGMLGDPAVIGIADPKVAPVIAAFASAHIARLEELRPLIAARGGQAYEETNTKLMESYGQTALDLVKEGKVAADALALAHALETLVAGTYQYFVSLTAEPALRAAMMSLGVKSSRRAAVAAQLIRGGTAAFAPSTDEAGAVLVSTLPNAFGSLSAVQVALGPVNETGSRNTVLMDTPSLNSLIY
jgi:hypothetical protein